MTGITLSIEQIRAAPPEVRRWIEHQVIAALGMAAASPAPQPSSVSHLVACSPEEIAAVLARILSSLFNYLCNRRLPQMRRKAFWPTAARYYVLWVFQLAGSVLGTWALCTAFGANELLAKYAVDILLSLLSYQVQLRWVFGGKGEKADV